MSFPNPPANPYLDATHPLAATLQSWVLFNGVQGQAGKNLVNRSVGRRATGVAALNFGGAPSWVPGAFQSDNTPSSMARFATNSNSIAYPFGGISQASCRAWYGNSNAPGQVADYTYFCMFKAHAIDASGNLSVPPVLLVGQQSSVLSQIQPVIVEGIALANIFASTGRNQAFLCFYGNQFSVAYGQNSPVYCTDSGGSLAAAGTVMCPVIPGHEYFAWIAFGNADQNNNNLNAPGNPVPAGTQPYQFMRFGLFDLTAGALISPAGDQYFSDRTGNYVAINQYHYYYGNPWFHQGVAVSDLVVNPGNGGAFSLRLAGIDNQCWDDSPARQYAATPSWVTTAGATSIGQYLYTNPYAVLTGTRPSSGSPPLDLRAASRAYSVNNQIVADPQATAFVPASTSGMAGVPGTLPLVAWGDSAITSATDTALTFDATDPIGAPHPIATWKLYGVAPASYPPNNGEPALASSATLPLAYSPPDAAIRIYQLTATDTSGAVYLYSQNTGALRPSPARQFFLTGNSLLTPTGSVNSGIAAAGSAAELNGFDLAIGTQGIDGAGLNQLTNANSSFYAEGIASPTSQLDFLLLRCQQEHAATGRLVDAVLLQVPGNSPGTTTAQYENLTSRLLSGTGYTASYTPSIAQVHLLAGPADLFGHTPSDMASNLGPDNTQIAAAAASNPTQVKFTGLRAQAAAVAYPNSLLSGHPAPVLAAIQGAGWVLDYLAANAGGGTSTDPGIAHVQAGTTYEINGSSLTGTYDPVTGRYTDPGLSHVQAGVTYTFAGSTETGTYSGGGSGATLAEITTLLAAGVTLAPNAIDAGQITPAAAAFINSAGMTQYGTVSAVNSPTSITVLFPTGAPVASQYNTAGSSYGSYFNVTSGAGKGQHPVISAADGVDSTHLTFTLAVALSPTPSAGTSGVGGDAVLVG